MASALSNLNLTSLPYGMRAHTCPPLCRSSNGAVYYGRRFRGCWPPSRPLHSLSHLPGGSDRTARAGSGSSKFDFATWRRLIRPFTVHGCVAASATAAELTKKGWRNERTNTLENVPLRPVDCVYKSRMIPAGFFFFFLRPNTIMRKHGLGRAWESSRC